MKTSGWVSQPNFTAIVHSTDGVLFVASSQCAEHLCSQIVTYIRRRCDEVLWPATAEQVRALIDSNQMYAAIALYFAAVGDRWDEERLELGGLRLSTLGISNTLSAAS